MAASLEQDEKIGQMIERTAKAIFIGSAQTQPMTEGERRAWDTMWATCAPGSRVRCRNQAQAALAASQLLDRVRELEQQIARAKTDLECYDHTPSGNRLARRDAIVHLIDVKSLPSVGKVNPS